MCTITGQYIKILLGLGEYNKGNYLSLIFNVISFVPFLRTKAKNWPISLALWACNAYIGYMHC